MELWGTFKTLGIALAIGLLIGTERGWHQRDRAEGSRVAGLRTFGLIGLAGGATALLASSYGGWLLGVGLAVIGVLLLLGHWIASRGDPDIGMTTEVAALVTFLLAAMEVAGYAELSAAGAVVTAGLLGMKAQLHAALRRLEEYELTAGLQLALVTLVVLPVLPDEGYGPWHLFNPYALWLMVVLISAISFTGHFAVRIVGARRGLMLTGLFAGLAASTALTLAFSRLGKQRKDIQGLLAGAVVVASTTMFPRILVEVAVVNPRLLHLVVAPFLVLTATGAVGTGILWRRFAKEQGAGEQPPFRRPFEFRTALQFAALLAVVLFVAKLASVYLGDSGVYGVALISGLSDVDAITLSLSGMAGHAFGAEVAARGIVLAALANTAVKGTLVSLLCGGEMARAVVAVLAAVTALGLVMILVPGLALSF